MMHMGNTYASDSSDSKTRQYLEIIANLKFHIPPARHETHIVKNTFIILEVTAKLYNCDFTSPLFLKKKNCIVFYIWTWTVETLRSRSDIYITHCPASLCRFAQVIFPRIHSEHVGLSSMLIVKVSILPDEGQSINANIYMAIGPKYQTVLNCLHLSPVVLSTFPDFQIPVQQVM